MGRDLNDIAREGGPEAVRQAVANGKRIAKAARANGHADEYGDGMAVPLAAIPAHAAGLAATVQLSEDALAVIFAGDRQGELLHDTLRGRWCQWSGTHWKADEGACVTRELIRETIRNLCGGKPKWGTARVVGAVEILARTDKRLRQLGGFDSDPLRIGTPVGVVNLADGTLRKAKPEDLITKQTVSAPDFDAACPRWFAFLGACIHGFDEHGNPREAAPDDPMVIFLQRMCGYMLTGLTRFEFVFLLFGGGANGKTTFLRVLREILGDYFVSVAVETFLQSAHDPHPTGMAHLEGARLAACGELPDNRAWNSERVKNISSGEMMAARFMRQDFYDFVPVCKLLFVGNHRPRLRQVDEAETRRFLVIPFVHRVPDARRNPALEAALRDEYPAIFAWMLDGAMAVIAGGFGSMPAAVTQATADYFMENDSFAQWADERLLKGKEFSVPSGRAYADYKRWFGAEGREGRPISTADFKTHMETWGAPYKKTSGPRVFLYVALNDDG